LPLGLELSKWYQYDLTKSKGKTAKALSTEEMQRMKELFKKHRIFKVVEELDFQKINKVKCYHYKIALDREGALAYFEALAKERGQEVTAEMRRDLNETLDNAEKLSGEIWIGKRDYLVRKVILDVPLESEGTKVDLNIDLNITDYNFTVEIIEPEGALEYKGLPAIF